MRVVTLVASMAFAAFTTFAENLTSEEPIPILRQKLEINPDGTFTNAWEGGNGIKVDETGWVKFVDEEELHVVSGKISWIDEEGNPIELSYVADENGYQPQGDHIPTTPKIPESVVRTLEYIAAHPHTEKTEDEYRTDRED